jgi:PAS domain S-box-containing protein
MSKGLEAASPRDDGWYRTIFDQNPNGVFVVSAEGAILECNRAFAETLGYESATEVQTLTPADIFIDSHERTSFLSKLRQKNALTNFEWCARGRLGRKIWLLVNIRLLEPRRLEAWAIGSAVDITERKHEDEETQKHIRLTASVADLGQLALRRTDDDHLLQMAVERVACDLEVDYCQVLDRPTGGDLLRFVAGAGWSSAGAHPLRFDSCQVDEAEAALLGLKKEPHSSAPQTLTGAHLLMEQGFASAMSVAIGSDDGPRGILSVHSHKVRYFDDQEVSFLQSAANVLAAALKQQETDQELRTSEERLRLAMEAATLGIWDRDLKTDQITWSRSQAVLFGLPPDQLRGTYAEFHGLIHPDDRARVELTLDRAREDKTAYSHEYRIIRSDGVHWITGKGRFFYDDDGQAYRVMGVVLDVSERRRLEEQYRHAQKMEAVGRFAGGVAHDFNNLLTVINGYSDMLLNMIPLGAEAYELVQQIRNSGERGANLTRQVLAFSRHQVVASRTLNVNAVLRDMESMLRRLIGEDLDFHTDPDPHIGLVNADPGQLDQVIVNLVINARDAMPTGGTLIVSTRNLEFTPADVQERPDARPGRYVMLSVSDTGSGMDDSTLTRIFEPFFTTKGDQGTGLGLATVYSIVHQASGFIEVASAPGQGAAFHIYLPCVEKPTEAVQAPITEAARAFRSNDTVLLVEDENGVRKLVRHMLEALGLHVLEASGGREALDLCLAYPEPVHLLVSDVVMPRMSGKELADRLRISRPEMRVLFISGYVDDAVVLRGVLHAEAVFLQKPFDAVSLAEKVHEALSKR